MTSVARAPAAAQPDGCRDFTTVTETASDRVTRTALRAMWTRYEYASELAAGGRVLEVACGIGQGLGLLASRARFVVGGDCTAGMVADAKRHYGARIPLLCLDAHRLPFSAGSFDLVLLYEAIYYLREPATFLDECRRVLAPGGRIVICTVNPEWAEFNPSPHSVAYYSASQLAEMLREAGFEPLLHGAFDTRARGARDRVVAVIKRVAVALRLMPRTMRGKRLLKRMFLGRLVNVPRELGAERLESEPLTPLASDEAARDYAVVYATGRVVPE